MAMEQLNLVIYIATAVRLTDQPTTRLLTAILQLCIKIHSIAKCANIHTIVPGSITLSPHIVLECPQL